MSENTKTLKRLSLKKLNKDEEIICTVERIVNGKFGKQPIATIDGIEHFLPSHSQLVRKVEETGIRKVIRVKLVEFGNKTKETEYIVEEVAE